MIHCSNLKKNYFQESSVYAKISSNFSASFGTSLETDFSEQSHVRYFKVDLFGKVDFVSDIMIDSYYEGETAEIIFLKEINELTFNFRIRDYDIIGKLIISNIKIGPITFKTLHHIFIHAKNCKISGVIRTGVVFHAYSHVTNTNGFGFSPNKSSCSGDISSDFFNEIIIPFSFDLQLIWPSNLGTFCLYLVLKIIYLFNALHLTVLLCQFYIIFLLH